MANVALIVHLRRPAAVEGARSAAKWLLERGHRVRLTPDDAKAMDRPMLAHEGDLTQDLNLAVALGGDGTILRAVGLMAQAEIPVLGVNLGRLGFLTDVEPSVLIEALSRFLGGEFLIEERVMLAVQVELVTPPGQSSPDAFGTDRSPTLFALNEAVVERSSPGHTVHVAVSVGSRPWTTYAADGLIVATPTGSTAYAFSAGGPILSPRLRALQLTPVAPHMPFDRTLVVGADEAIRILVTEPPAALLVVDGRPVGTLG
ncbi:MAG: NAD(+)/NADH kinase, partial [Pseudonocardiaceae bacterium]